MNVAQAVCLVVAEMSHRRCKASMRKSSAAPDYVVNPSNLLMNIKVMDENGVLPACIKNKPACEMTTSVIAGVPRWAPLLGPLKRIPVAADRN